MKGTSSVRPEPAGRSSRRSPAPKLCTPTISQRAALRVDGGEADQVGVVERARLGRREAVAVDPQLGALEGLGGGVVDHTAAEALEGTELWVDRDRLPAPEAGAFYHADLIGLAAVDPEGRALGEIVGVHNFGAGDLLELRPAGSGRTELVPFTEAFVPEVDLAARRVVVLLPGGEDD